MTDYSKKSKTALQELYDLSDNGFYTMAKLEWWLLKYEKLFDKVCILNDYDKEENRYRHFRIGKDHTCETILIDVFSYMDWLSKIRRYEPKIKEVLEEYESIKYNHKLKQVWIEKYNPVWDQHYFDFLMGPYGGDDVNDELQLYMKDLNNNRKFEYLYKKDFKYTCAFMEVYWEVYEDSDLAKKEQEEFKKEQEAQVQRKDTLSKIVEAFKTLDFDDLESLLYDDTTYTIRNLSKSRFIDVLKRTMNSEMYNHIKTFDRVEAYSDFCNHCMDGTIYRFIYKNKLALELCFEISLVHYILEIRLNRCEFKTDKNRKIEKIHLKFNTDEYPFNPL